MRHGPRTTSPQTVNAFDPMSIYLHWIARVWKNGLNDAIWGQMENSSCGTENPAEPVDELRFWLSAMIIQYQVKTKSIITNREPFAYGMLHLKRDRQATPNGV